MINKEGVKMGQDQVNTQVLLKISLNRVFLMLKHDFSGKR